MANEYLEQMLVESDTNPLGLPSGVLFQDHLQLKEMENHAQKLSALFSKKGYVQAVPPMFEYYETFEKGSGADIARRSFSFKDREGKLLSLRYDMTTPIARMAAMKYSKSDTPLKFYYYGDVFREQQLHKGKLRQIKQAGVEIIGGSRLETDAEAITCLCESLELLDKDFTVVFGDISYYKHLVSSMNLSEEKLSAVHSTFNKKDTVTLRHILSTIKAEEKQKEFLLKLPAMVGKAEKIEAEIAGMPADLTPSDKPFFELLKNIPDRLKSHIIVDLGLIKDFSYYTSLIMEGYIKGVGFPVANGGRYDDLFKSFGQDFPAVGFAIDLSFCW